MDGRSFFNWFKRYNMKLSSIDLEIQIIRESVNDFLKETLGSRQRNVLFLNAVSFELRTLHPQVLKFLSLINQMIFRCHQNKHMLLIDGIIVGAKTLSVEWFFQGLQQNIGPWAEFEEYLGCKYNSKSN